MASSNQPAQPVYANDGNEELTMLPEGYHFSPSSEVAIHYLTEKIFCRKLPADIIKTIDLYKLNPDEIPREKFKYGNKGEWYFFTRRPKGDLVVKGGYWQPTSYEEIEVDGAIIGFKQVLAFYYGVSPNGAKSDWLIDEFRLNPDSFKASELEDHTKTKIQDFVLCKVSDTEKTAESMIPDSAFEFPDSSDHSD